MLRISEEGLSSECATLRLEGEVIGLFVNEVRRACENLLAANRQLTLDLADVTFISREGIALFQNLLKRQVALINCSPFLTEQLKGTVSPEGFDSIER